MASLIKIDLASFKIKSIIFISFVSKLIVNFYGNYWSMSVTIKCKVLISVPTEAPFTERFLITFYEMA